MAKTGFLKEIEIQPTANRLLFFALSRNYTTVQRVLTRVLREDRNWTSLNESSNQEMVLIRLSFRLFNYLVFSSSIPLFYE